MEAARPGRGQVRQEREALGLAMDGGEVGAAGVAQVGPAEQEEIEHEGRVPRRTSDNAGVIAA